MSHKECLSRIFTVDDKVENKNRYRTAGKEYYMVYVDDGEVMKPALFTEAAIKAAIERAEKNPEDVYEPKIPGALAKLFGCWW